MNIKHTLQQFLRQPSIAELEAQELDNMERQLLEVQRNEEYYRNMAQALHEGIARLKSKNKFPTDAYVRS